MYEIVEKRGLNESVTLMKVKAPYVTRRCRPGQFVILRAFPDSERIPLTIADYDREAGVVTIIYQIVGASTTLLDTLNVGDGLADIVGPLGKPSEIEGENVCVVGGGVGCAIALPTAKAYHQAGARVEAIVGFRNRELIILEDEFRAVTDKTHLVTDDGSAGEKGLVTDILRRRIDEGAGYDRVIAIGPVIMMKFVSALTREYGIPTTVSMNPVMIDGTGMCGGCRLTVGGETVFACVDGPEFDGHKVDFDEAMKRLSAFKQQESRAIDETCNLLKGVK